jgi:L,D-peptidoglycan transpeptidase YkuD (ErfK/YbiS/YcfS/YnhG family)
MRILLLFLTLFGFLLTNCSENKTTDPQESSTTVGEMETPTEKAPEYQQIITVHTADWDAVDGTLRRFEWNGESWTEVGSAIEIVVGKKGMGWGTGLENYQDREGPVKHEGDLKSPAGAFALGSAFGYAPASEVNWIKTDYHHVTPRTMCIEDGTSAYYNQIIYENEAQPDWNSTDRMLRKDDLYEWGLFVVHNSPEAVNGDGSCIFLHVAEIDDDGTAGCTAMAKPRMLEILQWVDETKNPILIQTPNFIQKEFHGLYGLDGIF